MELNFPYTLSFRVLPTKKVISEKGKKGKKTMNKNCLGKNSTHLFAYLFQTKRHWPYFSVRLWRHFVNFWVKIEVIKHMLS